MRIDSVRAHSRQKVLRIVNRFNSHMPFQQKQEIADKIYEMTVRYQNLGVDLICATITHETAQTWDPRTISNAGAMGLMQIMPSTGKYLAKREGIKWTSAEDILFDPVYNIRLGSRYMSGLIKAYELEGGLAAYNGGLQRAEKWLASNKSKGVLFEETRDYVPLVLKWYDRFKDITM
ncbi:transglycosylase SLT domain-containing protein [candidate division KSB1 bacterium]|nr:lytic transglycosylase domain-containing protein [candidate division KSB1 bacterium]NIS24637.1 lytic transglycosylase domain-containing protein [candidate division KSB1 bacterium]NIU25237.1 lytic transglycosylase domain-containing protein [candidate division KSB1 bacterium]NIU91908.1 transglycosylase SLT domain-containing protein [candidate division KSB1 bacterium]NIV97000.1 transglycosylase SLT domain-containing protein [candidate division KSB1 bacterium]